MLRGLIASWSRKMAIGCCHSPEVIRTFAVKFSFAFISLESVQGQDCDRYFQTIDFRRSLFQVTKGKV